MGDAVWLYAVAGERDPFPLDGVTGVAGEPVRVVRWAGLAAVVGTVGLDEFGEEGLRHNLEDLDWLAGVARAHDAVVHAVTRLGPAVPLRLATVYRDDDRLRAALAERRADFDAALRRVTGRTEWGVKVYADRDAAAVDSADDRADGADGADGAVGAVGAVGAGTAYLLRRRARLSAREAVEHRAAEEAERVHEELLRVAVASRHNPAQNPRLLGKPAWMVLNGTYLVDDERADEFAAVVRAHHARHPGVQVELTGPWPPYSFATVEES
jgi:hypothetical protein